MKTIHTHVGSSQNGVETSEIEETKSKSSPQMEPKLTSVSSVGIQLLVHILCVVIYLIPILTPNPYGGPTLDELHIMSPENKDISGESRLIDVFKNDYWGRPMTSESSHRSWRPMTVLTFRYLKGFYSGSQLTMHRCVNAFTHAAAAEAVGILATQLFAPPTPRQTIMLKMITKVVFALHPTHVEVAANAANRNHIMAILFSATLADPECPLWFFALALVAGFLSSETFLFQVPAAIVTATVIQYCHDRRRKEGNDDANSSRLSFVVVDFLVSALKIFPRIFFQLLAVGLYLGGRAYFDTLDIPEGLIRPAENPFYSFAGEHRVRNYLYILAIHVGKSWGMDPIGFSHEYGFECVPALEDWSDPRLSLVFVVAATMMLSLVMAFVFPRSLLGPVAIHMAWSLTLFPVSGLVKVGTFISDRIVVASTVSVSMWVGFGIWYWLTKGMNAIPAAPLQSILVGWLISVSYLKVHNRSLEWMDSISLLKSSLVTCPRFAKAHMEMSKIYSGLYPHKFNLSQAREHLDTAREIDPQMCDLHQQFAHVAIQEGNYLEYENELTQAVLCPFTMGGALPAWQRYWQVANSNARTDQQRMELHQRQTKHATTIQEAVAEAQRKEAEEANGRKK
jgi:protein O-mannosyl-transferase